VFTNSNGGVNKLFKNYNSEINLKDKHNYFSEYLIKEGEIV